MHVKTFVVGDRTPFFQGDFHQVKQCLLLFEKIPVVLAEHLACRRFRECFCCRVEECDFPFLVKSNNGTVDILQDHPVER